MKKIIFLIFLIILISFLLWNSFRDDNSEYVRVAEQYIDLAVDVGFDISASMILSNSIIKKIDYIYLWREIDKSEKIEQYHAYADLLGIAWRKNENKRIEWYYLSYDQHNEHVLISESGGPYRKSTELYDFFKSKIEVTR